MGTEKDVDIVSMQLVRDLLYSVVAEMSAAVVHSSVAPITRDAFDFQCSIAQATGELVLEHEGSAINSFVFPPLINRWLEMYRDSIHPGDIFITNDPYGGGNHLPDAFLGKPIFIRGELGAWAVVGGHLLDVGGRVPGSVASDTTDLYQEGLRIPSMKLYDRGVPNETLFRVFEANVRTPLMTLGGVRGFCAACYTGEGHFLELAEALGWETLKNCMVELLNYSERRTRAEIRAMPDGVYEFLDYLDDDGFDNEPIPICVKITVDGDTMTYDFTGTSPQKKGAVNHALATTVGNVFCAFRCLLSPDVPCNSGQFRPVRVIVPEGTVVNPNFPAAMGASGVTEGRIHDVLLGAQAQIAPSRMPACAVEVDHLIIVSGRDDEGKIYVLSDPLCGSWGARPYADGPDYNTPIWVNLGCQPAEVIEGLFPVMIRRWGYLPDTEGAGKFRGGLAVIREWEFLGDEATVNIRGDRCRFLPYGLQGGQRGAPSMAMLNPESDRRELGKTTITVKKGDVLRVFSAGAGGFGDPLDRDAGMVMEDVRNEKVSVRRAREVYGVLIDEGAGGVDIPGTAKLREAKRSRCAQQAGRQGGVAGTVSSRRAS